MLGAASEKAMLDMIESCGDSIADPSAKRAFKAEVEKAQSVFRKYLIFEKHFESVKPTLPKELTHNSDSLMRGVFDLIRNSRNDSGHPASGVAVDRDLVNSHLRLFIPYCKRVYELTAWFSQNQT